MKAIKAAGATLASISLTLGMAGAAGASEHHNAPHNVTITSTSQHGVFGNGSAIIHASSTQSNSNDNEQNSYSHTFAPVLQNSEGGTNVNSTVSYATAGGLGGPVGITTLSPTSDHVPAPSNNSTSNTTNTTQDASASNDNNSTASTTTSQSNTSTQSNSSSVSFSSSQ